jgi:hypothetical protein
MQVQLLPRDAPGRFVPGHYALGTRVTLFFASGVYSVKDLPLLRLDGRTGIVIGRGPFGAATPAYRLRVDGVEFWAAEAELATVEG